MFWKEALSNYFLFPSKDSQKRNNISKAVNNSPRNLTEYSFFFCWLERFLMHTCNFPLETLWIYTKFQTIFSKCLKIRFYSNYMKQKKAKEHSTTLNLFATFNLWLYHYLMPSSFKKWKLGTSLVVQWLRLCAPNVGGPGSIPGQGTRSHN